jgi:AcrR family transcriptional regulator
MAKGNTSSGKVDRGTARSEGTRALLVGAAIDTLKDVGFSGASARAIAERAGANQALIFYHFGSVANLLVAALDSVSNTRLERYETAVAETVSPTELIDAATAIFERDLDAGYITVLVELIAGASSTPGLGTEIGDRIKPWREFTQAAIERSFGDTPLAAALPSEDVAYAVVALYLGLEMLSNLDGDRGQALRLFSHAKQLAVLIGALSSPIASRTLS